METAAQRPPRPEAPPPNDPAVSAPEVPLDALQLTARIEQVVEAKTNSLAQLSRAGGFISSMYASFRFGAAKTTGFGVSEALGRVVDVVNAEAAMLHAATEAFDHHVATRLVWELDAFAVVYDHEVTGVGTEYAALCRRLRADCAEADSLRRCAESETRGVMRALELHNERVAKLYPSRSCAAPLKKAVVLYPKMVAAQRAYEEAFRADHEKRTAFCTECACLWGRLLAIEQRKWGLITDTFSRFVGALEDTVRHLTEAIRPIAEAVDGLALNGVVVGPTVYGDTQLMLVELRRPPAYHMEEQEALVAELRRAA
jgi:hypothetical protein